MNVYPTVTFMIYNIPKICTQKVLGLLKEFVKIAVLLKSEKKK